MYRACLIACLLLALASDAARAQCSRKGTAYEQTLRERALKSVMPEYPAEAKRAGAKGVVVTLVQIDERGLVSGVEVLEAPHPSIGRAAASAVRQWAFKPFQMPAAGACVEGKLTFYYVIEDDGRAYVRNPKRYR